MAALRFRKTTSLKDTSYQVSVPAHPRAKLMYYLDSVATVLQLDNSNLSRLRQYKQWYSLSTEEETLLLYLVANLSPDELEGKVFFQDENVSGFMNRFYELSHASNFFAVSSSVFVGGEHKRVLKIMLYKEQWMNDNFYRPFLQIQNEREAQRRRERQQQAQASNSCTIL